MGALSGQAQKMGMTDLSTAERSDIVDAFKGDDVDLLFIRKCSRSWARTRRDFFHHRQRYHGGSVPFKIIDLANNKYLYNGKFTEKGSDSTVIGLTGNKSGS